MKTEGGKSDLSKPSGQESKFAKQIYFQLMAHSDLAYSKANGTEGQSVIGYFIDLIKLVNIFPISFPDNFISSSC